ncbi:MAG TPA: hypothetical protein EYP49_21385 [Anaerolineae bacterium]|nr:hypothetical protein [Anaerolineae bacterium]
MKHNKMNIPFLLLLAAALACGQGRSAPVGVEPAPVEPVVRPSATLRPRISPTALVSSFH